MRLLIPEQRICFGKEIINIEQRICSEKELMNIREKR